MLGFGNGTVFQQDLIKVETGGSILNRNARRRDKSFIWASIIQLIMLANRGENIVIGFEFTPAQDNFAIGFVL